MKKTDTGLEIFTFGDKPEDKYYCLVNLKISPEGLDIEKIKLADPRNFDKMLAELGCITFLSGREKDELEQRGEISGEDLHGTIYNLCKKEGMM